MFQKEHDKPATYKPENYFCQTIGKYDLKQTFVMYNGQIRQILSDIAFFKIKKKKWIDFLSVKISQAQFVANIFILFQPRK